jgi:hypothetical protein
MKQAYTGPVTPAQQAEAAAWEAAFLRSILGDHAPELDA